MTLKKKLSSIDYIDYKILNDKSHNHYKMTIKNLEKAVTKTGFFVLKNSTISPKIIKSLFEQYKLFFKKPIIEKNKVNMLYTNSNRGWGPSKSEQVNNDFNPDFKEIYDCGPHIDFEHKFKNLPYYASNIWPEDMPLLQETAKSFYNQCNKLGIFLLNKIAMVINLPENYFADKFDLPMALLRCNFYPERPKFSNDKDYGIAPHTDYGCLTLLFTEGDTGLEIKPLEGKWGKVNAEKNDIIINFGDMLQLWSKDVVKATPHRVHGSQKVRYSIPFFFNPRHDTLISQDNNKKLLAGDYLAYKFDTTYTHKK